MKLLDKLIFLSCVDFPVCAEYLSYVTAMDCSWTIVLVLEFDAVLTADEIYTLGMQLHK